MRKYGESKTTRIIMATVPHVTSGLGLRKFQADGFLLTQVYMKDQSFFPCNALSIACIIHSKCLTLQELLLHGNIILFNKWTVHILSFAWI